MTSLSSVPLCDFAKSWKRPDRGVISRQTDANLAYEGLQWHDRSVPDESPIQPRYWNLEDVARYLSVSKQQVYAMVRSGELPAVKLGGRGVWRVDSHKLNDYLEKLEAETREWTKAHPLNARDDDQD